VSNGPPASSIVQLPSQNVSEPVMTGTGKGFSVTVTSSVPVHPLTSETVTV
jgi:hypothetical protein